MATFTETPRLPVIRNLQISYSSKTTSASGGDNTIDRESLDNSDGTRDKKASSLLASFGLGLLQRQPLPGDVYQRPYTSSANQPRPLGLLPSRRGRLQAMRELASPFFPPPVSAPVHSTRKVTEGSRAVPLELGEGVVTGGPRAESTQSYAERAVGGITAVSVNRQHAAGADATAQNSTPRSGTNGALALPFRLSSQNVPHNSASTIPVVQPSLVLPPIHQPDGEDASTSRQPITVTIEDREYIDTLAKCDIQEYGLSESVADHYRNPRQSPTGQPLSGKQPMHSQGDGWSDMKHSRAFSNPNPSGGGGNVSLSPSSKRASKLGRAHTRSSSLQFVSFTERAQICNRPLSDDRRDALDYEPCERCRLRGGRCSQCKALRTGGGYIILDGNELSEDHKRRLQRRGFSFGMPSGLGAGTNGRSGKHHRRGDLNDSSSHLVHTAIMEGEGDGGGKRELGGGRGEGSGGGGRYGWDDGRQNEGGERGGGGGRGMEGQDVSTNLGETDRLTGLGRRTSIEHDSDLDGRGMYGSTSGKERLGSAMGGRSVSRGRDDEGEGVDSGRQSVSSQRPVSRIASRPGSRPGSSMRRLQPRGLERREWQKREGLEKQSRDSRGRGHRERGGGNSGSGSDDDDERRRRRRRRGEGDGDDESGRQDRPRFKGGDKEEEDEEDGRFTGDLMRFRRKRDDVKALDCTLKDLQGIDPLDYLAKYCIVDPEKLPNYRRVYDNVDRDEDDDIDMAELDFALKAVNYNLISDAEMTYVHSVLELAGRYNLNFRLFSLIAALSEKVVALDDMVKRLINEMDFEALEVKMKKCKELFYLLADTEHESVEQGGVVTVGSLAVELQAGGLTADHVEFVVERLNNEGKGRVEFLDYLTYVPLFVEIHDNISGNPLDFTRTR